MCDIIATVTIEKCDNKKFCSLLDELKLCCKNTTEKVIDGRYTIQYVIDTTDECLSFLKLKQKFLNITYTPYYKTELGLKIMDTSLTTHVT